METTFELINLSKQKVAYSRVEDPKTSLIVRSYYPNVENGVRFGLKGLKEIRHLFNSLAVVINTSIDKIGSDNDMLTLAKIGENLLDDYEVSYTKKKDDPDHRGFYYIDNHIVQRDQKKILRIGLNLSVTKGQLFSLRIYKEEENIKTFQFGIFLFATETIKLAKYLNKRFNFEPNYVSINCGKDDDFF